MTEILSTILVDDEYLALDILQTYVERTPSLKLVAKAKSAIEAAELINNNNIDLIFLDIQMPFINGIDFLKELPQPPLTIFTTAYSDHAYEAFELDVVDYLLKPISFERFGKAVDKAKQLFLSQNHETKIKECLNVKHNGQLTKIPFSNILFVEALKEYVKIVCKDKNYVIFDRLKNIEQALKAPEFYRVHRSYLVAIDKINTINGSSLKIENHSIPISRGKRDEISVQIAKRNQQ